MTQPRDPASLRHLVVLGHPGLDSFNHAIVRACRLIVNTQNDEGGWRYNPVPYDADVSVTICQVMALRSARNAGIEVAGVETFIELRERKGPFIFFTGHLGCFELLPIGAAAYGLQFTALFRQPNNIYVAKRVQAARRTAGGHLIPSKAGAVWSLAGILKGGGSVGMLVDQKFRKGVRTTFFGHSVKTNPLVPKLARQYDAEVYPARCIRLANGRYRLELQPRLDLPRDAAGQIDVESSCQALNDVVEGWVRDHPDQWMWFHDRWQVIRKRKKPSKIG